MSPIGSVVDGTTKSEESKFDPMFDLLPHYVLGSWSDTPQNWEGDAIGPPIERQAPHKQGFPELDVAAP